MSNDELTLSVLRNIEALKTQRTLAEELGLSVGKVNYVLKALVEKGLIKAESFFANKNKNQYKYLLTEKGFNEKLQLTQKFIQRKKAEYDELVLELENMKGMREK
ncbi:MarR family EPS-associated transcriptional regulator [Sulfurimonas sp.]|uniref:MarR family EPS-associated transcriptional regulator n=1 Tax=Sulfurimonas sp. TaxID=2022749 RepID=UPI0025FA62F9|nr:MarR family EPS-associated transcriptional regulator [Sulfurimonas sp.]MCK9472262.1 MarR family EPS-associated transcriptional regulator [Sulfurimonas sp.]MDD3506002.1 MarR family EPS-associated transcriptional regulator [Sulfurimonas sp.]